MDNSLLFLYIVFGVSILLYAIGGIITATFVIPLQVKEAGVKNGLLSLRKQMLAKGVLSLFVAVISITVLTIRFFVHDIDTLRYIITTMIFLHAVGTIAKSFIDYRIYHQQYSIKSKSFHARIEALEKRERK